MADTFDFNNPLGLDEELEKENSLLGSPDIEKPQEEQNFDSVFEKNKNKKFVDRIINPENYPAPTLTDSQGRKQTHLMSADLDQNNDWVVYPKIILENNKYKRVNMEEAISSGNAINFGKNQDLAQGFSQNYKTKKFKEFYNEDKESFNFEDPLRQEYLRKTATGPVPSDFDGTPIGAAVGFIGDVFVKPVLELGKEAEERYPDTAFENTKYILDGIKATDLKSTAEKVFTFASIVSTEEATKYARGEAQLGGIDYGGSGYADMYNAQLQIRSKDKYKNDPKYKKAVDDNLKKAQEESQKEFKRIDKAIAKKRADNNLGPYGSDISSAVESIAVIGTGMAVNYLSGGTSTPAITGATLSYFGIQTAAASYSEAVQQGLPHDTALGYSTINGILEAGTEMVPVIRFLSPKGRGTIKDVIKTDLITVAADVGMENINSVLQEINSVWFDLESELKTAYENKNDPLYEGRSVGEVLVDIAGHTTLSAGMASGSISAFRTTGGVIYSKEVKDFIRNQKDNPELELFIENFNNNVNNLTLNYNAIDSASRILLDPNANGKGWTADEVIALEYFNQPFIDFRKPLVVGEEGEVSQSTSPVFNYDVIEVSKIPKYITGR